MIMEEMQKMRLSILAKVKDRNDSIQKELKNSEVYVKLNDSLTKELQSHKEYCKNTFPQINSEAEKLSLSDVVYIVSLLLGDLQSKKEAKTPPKIKKKKKNAKN